MIPKSLHTVTVLVQVTKHVYDNHRDSDMTMSQALQRALWILGYSDNCPDVHGLTLQALNKLRK
jgi:hypothetical protein